MLYDAILGRLDKNKEIIISDMAFSVKVVLDKIIKPISIPVSCWLFQYDDKNVLF
jgi:hypothetical protein